MKRKRQSLLCGAACAAAVLIALSGAPSMAETDVESAVRGPGGTMRPESVALRSHEEMVEFDARALGPAVVQAPRRRSDVPDATLAAWKAAAARSVAPAAGKASSSVGTMTAPISKGISFAGVNRNEGGGFFPPDTHGTVGPSHFLEVTNDHVDIFTKSSPQRVNGCASGASPPCPGVTLNAFFGYSTKSLFDPRAIYDRLWNRYVISAEAFPESTTVQYYFFAISQTSNPLGKYWIFKANAHGFIADGQFYDFPQLGMDQDSLIFTANVFAPSEGPFVKSTLFSIPKALYYNGKATSVPVFNPACFAPNPPIVLDRNATTFIACAINANSSSPSTTINLFKLTNSSRTGTALSGAIPVTVSSYSVPPAAKQPGTTAVLDSGDNRFSNNGYQSGNFLYLTHDVALGGFSAPRLYKVNTSTNTVPSTDTFFASSTSFDFNPSVAVDISSNVYVTWSSTDPPASLPAQVRFGGFKAADTFHVGSGTLMFQSGVVLTGNPEDTGSLTQRWGDYSAVSIDPSVSLQAWLVNEQVNSASVWGTRIGNFGF